MRLTGLDEARTEPSVLPTLSEYDVTLGFPFGTDPSQPVEATPDDDPARALRAALRPALFNTPCVLRVVRPALRRERLGLSIRHDAAQPLRWDASVHSALQQRAATIGGQTFRAVRNWYGCKQVEPLGSPGFVASLAAFGGRWGLGGRSAVLRLLADGLLPEAIIERRDKAYFNASRFGPATAEFVGNWDGTGLDDDLVDAEVLRDVWSAELVPAPTTMLLQQAWLSTEAGR